MDIDLTTLAKSIETLCTVEMREPGPSYNVIRRLYESGRKAQAGYPTELAIRALTSQRERRRYRPYHDRRLCAGFFA